MVQQRRRPSGFIEPCQPSKVALPPSSLLWLHEIKHDGYRLGDAPGRFAGPLLRATGTIGPDLFRRWTGSWSSPVHVNEREV